MARYFMIEIVFKIDCEKTEKALKAVAIITETEIPVIVKDWLKLNLILIETAEEIKKDNYLYNGMLKTYGEKTVNDLMDILK